MRNKKELQKLARIQELVSIAIHESGHVIIALLHFMRISEVKITEIEPGIFEGHAEYETIFDYRDFSDDHVYSYKIHSEICMFYSGLAAEKYHYKKMCGSDQFPNILKNGSESDTKSAYNLIKKYINIESGTRTEFKNRMIKMTLHDLECYWDDVVLLSHTLFKKKKLNESDLRHILTTKSENKSFWKAQFKTIKILFSKLEKLSEQEVKNILI